MKMKSILVSMLAIAALASCTRQEFIDPPGPVTQGEKMLVDLTINGSSLSTKAAGAATNDNDKVIKNLTVFGVNTATEAIITRTYFGTVNPDPTTGVCTVEFTTTDQTTEIHVIANIGEDLTGAGKSLNVNTLKALKNAKASLIVTTPQNAPKQTEGDVLMSGSTTTVTPGVSGANATASVDLKFIASKIILKALTRGTGSTGTYGTDFKFTQAMMTNVQTSAYYVRGTDSYIDLIAGDVRPAMDPLTWATGRDLSPSPQTDALVADFSQSLTTVTQFDNANPINDVAYWYVFENSSTTKHTTLLIEYLWKQFDNSGQGAMDKTMYFPITFGGGDKPAIEPGKAYAITLTFNGNFSPEDQGGGGGGGGTPDPDTPIVPEKVDVAVTPADWGNVTDTDKDFGQ